MKEIRIISTNIGIQDNYNTSSEVPNKNKTKQKTLLFFPQT